MLIPGIVLLAVGLLLMYLTAGVLSTIGLVCAVVGAILVIVALVQLATARSNLP
jgi:hypothetical protein